jgi:hypothetical protein
LETVGSHQRCQNNQQEQAKTACKQDCETKMMLEQRRRHIHWKSEDNARALNRIWERKLGIEN